MDSLSSTNVVEQSLQQTTADTTTTVITQPSLTATPEIELLDTNTIDRFISKKKWLFYIETQLNAVHIIRFSWIGCFRAMIFLTVSNQRRSLMHDTKRSTRYILKNAAELFTYDKTNYQN